MVKNSTFRPWLLLALFLMAAAMVGRPEKTAAAAAAALQLWARAVVPSLLPFFILARLLIDLGAAELAGRRLAPLMRPLFDLPGAASLGVVMGFCSGFPTGAMVAAALRRQGAITAEEGGRLLAFTNNAGPLYVTVTVAASLLGCAEAAPLLVAGHYGIDLLLGVGLGRLCRCRRGRNGPEPRSPKASDNGGAGWGRLPLAALLKAAAQRAAADLMLIGGYMAFFAVAAALLTPDGSGSSPLLRAGISGLLEMSLGISALAQCGLPPEALLPLAAALLALGGLSVQLQVLAMTADTDISPRLYLLCRPLHALLSFGFTRAVLGWVPLKQAVSGGAGPVFSFGRLLYASMGWAVLAGAGWLLAAALMPRRE